MGRRHRLNVRTTPEAVVLWQEVATDDDVWTGDVGGKVVGRHEAAPGIDLSTHLGAVLGSLSDPHLIVRSVPDDAGDVADFVAIWANPTAGRGLGRGVGDVAGLTLSELFPAGARDLVRGWCSEVARSGESLVRDDSPLPGLGDDGGGWFDVRIDALGESDAPAGDLCVSWRDVTARHLAAQRLADSEARYRLLADSASDVILLTGVSRTIEWVSPSVVDVLGWQVEDVIGRRVADLMHPGDLARLAEKMRALRDAGEQGGRFESRFRMADGGWRWVSGVGRALHDDLGNVVGGIDTLRDVQAEHDATMALEASDAHFRLLAEHTSDVVVQLTPDGRVAWVSPSVERVLGWTSEQVVGRSGFTLLHKDDEPALTGVLNGGVGLGWSDVRAVRVRRQDGGFLWMEASTQLVPGSASVPESLVSRLRDVDAQRRAFRALQRSEERFRLAMVSAPIGMAVERVGGGLTEVNPALGAMLGRSSQWLLAHPLREVVHRDDDDLYRRLRDAALEGPADSAMRELRLVTSSDRSVWVQLALGVVRDEGGRPTSLVWQIVDITETRRAHDVLEFLAAHDPLTDVKNRRAWVATLTARLLSGPGVAIIYADIDGLKPINDQLGHAAGDTLILEVARRFSRVLGADDTIGRLGGDEFVALLADVSGLDDAMAVAERVRRAVSEPLNIDGVEVGPGVSLGVAFALPGELPEALLRRADAALYRAKQAGGGRVVADS